MYSLQSRLGFWLAFFLILFFGANILFMGYFSRYLAEEHILTRLQQDANILLSQLKLDSDNHLHIYNNIPLIYQNSFSGYYYQIKTDNSEKYLLSPSLNGTPLNIQQNIKKIGQLHLRDAQDTPLLGWSKIVYLSNHPVNILIAQEITDIDEDINNLRIIYFIVTILTVLSVILFQSFIIRRELHPVELAKQELVQIQTAQIQPHISQQLPLEIQPFVDELNHLLEVMNKRLKRSRNATGNLAHALKTPLSVLIQLIESPEIKNQSALAEELTQICNSIQFAIDRQLKRARLSGGTLTGQSFFIDRDISELINIVKKVYASKNLDIQFTIPSKKRCYADREDLLEMFGNLLDNACKWAQYCVNITIYDTQGLSFSIADDGPGISAENRVNLVKRGTRLDEEMPGHGLGLAIVTEIITQYNGSIKFEASTKLGGLNVLVKI